MTADSLFETTSIPGHLAPTPERLGRLLSKQTLEELYEVEEQPFARGKYATVRRCRERSSGRQWAAKFLRKRRRAQELRAEALHEVAVLDAAAHCSRLVSLHQVFETNTEMVLVLELAPGGELQMILDRDEVPEERQVARLLKQILDGIAFLHSLNVAHLDIKPQNLVLTGEFPDCDVKLCDFGISRYISHGADIREILGTPDYVAPEVLNYEPISLATDMWSVGVLLYVLLTGCSPFGGDTKQETFCNISRCRLDFPDDLFEDVSEEARDLMRKLMVKDPNERLTVTECLQHPWLNMFEQPLAPLTTCPSSDDSPAADLDSSTTPSQDDSVSSKLPITNQSQVSSTPKNDDEKQQRLSTTALWEQRHHHRAARVWPRECSGVVSKALSRFTSETTSGAKIAKIPATTPPSSAIATTLRSGVSIGGCNKTGLEALRERGGNLVVIREPVRAGRYTRYSEVQCESVQARIRRLVHETS
ncbi:serine/threonine-protein kinase 17B-like [Pogonomyrmex barbatus]|uniref:non-specific serine/threonine protein kinase n=1 Tax=Pogonomyrmex barbatus TaxID=144034 RepID=A0A6I9WH17_9HYME|nr:serine/threonine-protein kinase 17B-like [Pogonomyrmex barbatus]